MSEWILSWTNLPNLHPPLVHFPIVLLPLATLFELGGLVMPRQDWLRRTALVLLLLTVPATWIAVESGEDAEHGLAIPASADAAVHEHEEWGERMFYAVMALAALRLGVNWLEARRERRRGPRLGGPPLRRPSVGRWLIALLLIVATCGIVYVSHLGGTLVYRHGLGVNSLVVGQ